MQRVISIFLILLFTVCTYAQQGINYKALIKDGGGNVIANQMITVQFQILQGAGMTNVYQETDTPTTDANGIIILNIGEVVTPDSGVFADIDWGSDTHFLNTKINTGAGLVDMGTTGFKAVPYALHAKTAESVSGISGTTNFVPKSIDGLALEDSQIFDDGTNVGVGTTSPLSKFHIAANTIGLRQQVSETGPSIGFYTSSLGAWFQTHNDFPLLFATNNSETQMILSTNGNLGIGIGAVVPTAKLDVAGDIKITDGTQGAGKILTSDADGLASWDDSVLNLITDLQAQITALEADIYNNLRVGDLYAGGVVFYIASPPIDLDGDGVLDKGLVCAFSDYATTVEWGCFGTDLPNVPNVTSGPSGLGAEIGDGINNTNNILNDCPSAPAALAARSYGPEWFLPSAKELNQMYINRTTLEAVTGFSAFSSFYWSSTEYVSTNAWRQNFVSGFQANYVKDLTVFVRAVRAF